MWNKKLQEIKKMNAIFGEEINDGATEKDIQRFLEEIGDVISEEYLHPYINVLKRVNGLEFNGFILYGIDSTLLNNEPKQPINGFIDNNRVWHENEWQRNLLQTVRNYSANFGDKWLFIGGQSGSGKTHLCTAVLQELVFNHRKEILLFEWAEKSKKLKQLINDPKYDEELSRYKSVSVLYIDDLFKVKRGETATAADVNLAFELLDYRDRENLTTIISSEFSIDDIISIDEATGGRIKYRAQEYALHIGKDRGKNYRLK